jgi:hypothetical protein
MRIAALLILGFIPGLLLDKKKDELPAMEIYSRFGVGEDVKLFNEEPITFFTRKKGDEGGEHLRNVGFVLRRAGPVVDRKSHWIADLPEKTSRWGRPISTFSLPHPKRSLPAGSYRLEASKRGYRPASIGVVQAYLRYFDLEVTHKKDRYIATLRFRLEDKTEKRKAMTLKIRVETEAGRKLDGTERRLLPVKERPGVFETVDRLRLSSNAKLPKRGQPAPVGRSLRVEPGCRLVVALGEVKVSWPVPIPAPNKRGNTRDRPEEDDPSKERGR